MRLPFKLLPFCLLAYSNVIVAAEPFSYAWLKGKARQLSTTPYEKRTHALPQAVEQLTWDEHQSILFDRDHALWNKEDSHFRAEFFHLGMYVRTPVTLYEVDHGEARRIDYNGDLFDYGKSGLAPDTLPADLGFAGFRVHASTDWERDVIAFLGASYFRAVGASMQYGLSARGLAIDTALPRPEEFPIFTEFYLQQPAPGADQLEIYALLDSPSVSGAYHFSIHPGEPHIVRVDAALYPRKPIERLGIAPLTSMYQVGENDRRMAWDWRPEIHDSDGLALHTGNGEWLWRPLANPPLLRFNSYFDTNPRGFGLLQRDRNFDHYQDDGVFYEKRPSLWIEPIGDWGAGAVTLTEIPTIDETFDNIVAFWQPAEAVQAGEEYLFSYNMYWADKAPARPQLATTVATHSGLGGVIGRHREYYSHRFVIDFTGGPLGMLGPDTKVEAVVESSRGHVETVSARPLHSINGYRARFDIVPGDSTEPVNLRMYLKAGDRPLSETWIYQWTPPPLEQRELYNR
ncbi:glucan biosynthesis protein [Coraliomargarita parva]|uniref:glucan biosynthesis protein n=1 Tax=Coraliomargarita parva TaxID=3014050 RepID=UPI0022B49A4D|nr:glucan biosynthesis protein D [Coraliomargarita parva]